MAELNWSDAQWQKVKDAITEAFNKASVASAFLPMYGPLPGSAETVRNERLKEHRDPDKKRTTVKLDADHSAANLRLVNLTVNVELSSEQVADETLSNALLAFRRAANILAQEQDRVVFAGFRRGPRDQDSEFVANRIDPQQGLADLRARSNFRPLEARDGRPLQLPADNAAIGPALVTAVVDAIRRLEDRFHPAPFACVLSNELFNKAHDPTDSLVLPADRITPLLKGGPLIRSGRMAGSTGILVSLAGNAVDLVVGTPPTAQFLQRNDDARFLFRVYERFVLRIRDAAKPPVAGFRIGPTADTRVDEAQLLEELARQEAASPDARVQLATAAREAAEVQRDLGA